MSEIARGAHVAPGGSLRGAERAAVEAWLAEGNRPRVAPMSERSVPFGEAGQISGGWRAQRLNFRNAAAPGGRTKNPRHGERAALRRWPDLPLRELAEMTGFAEWALRDLRREMVAAGEVPPFDRHAQAGMPRLLEEMLVHLRAETPPPPMPVVAARMGISEYRLRVLRAYARAQGVALPQVRRGPRAKA